MELKKAQIITLKKYKFDRIMRYNNQYYLMKVDEPFKLLLWLIPFLEWLLPHKFYLIDKQTVKKLMFVSDNHKHYHWLFIMTSAIMGPIVATLIINLSTYHVASIFAIIFEFVMALIIRYFASTLSIAKAYLNKSLVYKGFLFPSVKNNFKALYSPFLFMIVGIFFARIGIAFQLQVSANFFIALETIACMLFILIGNSSALLPGEFYLFKFKLLIDNTKKQITSKEIN